MQVFSLAFPGAPLEHHLFLLIFFYEKCLCKVKEYLNLSVSKNQENTITLYSLTTKKSHENTILLYA